MQKDFFKFLVIGAINTLSATALAIVYSLASQLNVAFILGYLTALVLGYVLNSVFVFYQPVSWVKLGKFAVSYIPNFVIQNGVVLLFYNLLDWNRLITIGLAGALGLPVTFLLLKLYAFRQKNTTQK